MREWDDWLGELSKEESLSLFFPSINDRKNFCKVELALVYLRLIENSIDSLPEYLSGYFLLKDNQLQVTTTIIRSRIPAFAAHSIWKQKAGMVLISRSGNSSI